MRMKEAMSSAGLPAPRIKQREFYAIIFKRPVSEELGEKGGQNEEKIRRKYGEKGAEDTTRKITQKRLAEGLAEKLVERLVESQQRILELIKENPYISKKELSLQLQ